MIKNNYINNALNSFFQVINTNKKNINNSSNNSNNYKHDIDNHKLNNYLIQGSAADRPPSGCRPGASVCREPDARERIGQAARAARNVLCDTRPRRGPAHKKRAPSDGHSLFWIGRGFLFRGFRLIFFLLLRRGVAVELCHCPVGTFQNETLYRLDCIWEHIGQDAFFFQQ